MKIMFVEGTIVPDEKEYAKYKNYLEKVKFPDENNIEFYYNYSLPEDFVELTNNLDPDEAPEGEPCLMNIESAEVYGLGMEISQLAALDKERDCVVFLPSWSTSTTARIKHTICQMYNIKCVYIEETISRELLNN